MTLTDGVNIAGIMGPTRLSMDPLSSIVGGDFWSVDSRCFRTSLVAIELTR